MGAHCLIILSAFLIFYKYFISIQHKKEQQQKMDCKLLIFLIKLPFHQHPLSLVIGSTSH